MQENSVIKLRDTEQAILNYMLLSNTNFLSIKQNLSESDFTFSIHKIIFECLVDSEEMFLSNGLQNIFTLNANVEKFAITLKKEQNIKKVFTLDILSQPPSLDIQKDLEIINANSMEKEIALSGQFFESWVTIETKDCIAWLNFIDNRLMLIDASNIAMLPLEVSNDFNDVFDSLSSLDLKNGENEAQMTFSKNFEYMERIESIYLKKDLAELKWVDEICLWADKYELSEDIFPRDRYQLEELIKLDLINLGINDLPKEIGKLVNLRILLLADNNIKVFPKELYELKSLLMLSFSNNKISSIAKEISNFKELLYFNACNNNITELPIGFYNLTTLQRVCLHGNKFTDLPSKLGNLSNLTFLTISNNEIEVLPQSIVNLKELEVFEIENTKISEIPADLIKYAKIRKLCINDNLLPALSKNIEYLNIDRINLSASNYQESSQTIQELGLEIDKKSELEKTEGSYVLLFDVNTEF